MKDYTCQDNSPPLFPPLNSVNDLMSHSTCINQQHANSPDKLSHQFAGVKSDNLAFNRTKPPLSTNTIKLPSVNPTPYVTRSGRQVKPKIVKSE